MTKVLHQSSHLMSNIKSSDVLTSDFSSQGERHHSNYSQSTNTSVTGCAMSLGDILKIAEISRKYGPLFYQDSIILRSLGIPTRNLMPCPRNGLKDNLCLIMGVTNEIEKKLNELGIWHYDQICSMNDEDIFWLEEKMIFEKGYVHQMDWKKQCKKFQLDAQSLKLDR